MSAASPTLGQHRGARTQSPGIRLSAGAKSMAQWPDRDIKSPIIRIRTNRAPRHSCRFAQFVATVLASSRCTKRNPHQATPQADPLAVSLRTLLRCGVLGQEEANNSDPNRRPCRQQSTNLRGPLNVSSRLATRMYSRSAQAGCHTPLHLGRGSYWQKFRHTQNSFRRLFACNTLNRLAARTWSTLW